MNLKGTIVVNQLGYRPEDIKLAVIENEAGRFQIVDAYQGAVVWEGESTELMEDKVSGVMVSKLDFTGLTAQGEYTIQGQKGQSIVFKIDKNVYKEAHKAVLKAFYYLRCGVELDEQFAGEWKHGPCHCTPAIIYNDQARSFDGNGGWHDAGDYGKYIVAAGKAVADMLLAYELYPQAFASKVPLPESDDYMDDLLHEVKVELDWMLKMQDSASGGVYHKLTTLQFPPLDMMPEDDTAALYAMPISGTATASFAATMAMAARVYEPYNKEYSQQCLAAAQLAWQWLEMNPNAPDFKNPHDVGTGEYGDKSDADERYWAAAELFRTTGEPKYHAAFKHFAANDDIDKTALGWANMGGYGTISYLLNKRPKDDGLAANLQAVLSLHAKQLAENCKQDGFGISLLEEHYRWGSNMDLMNHAIILLITQYIEQHDSYRAEIAAHLHHLLGMNVNGYSYISGYGHRAMMSPHHRPSVADGVEAPVPGMVSGGPNRNLQDECAAEHVQGCAPAACYIDHIDSYSTNEITIYWNSPALFVLSAFVTE